jgi:hypothetical protein
MEVNLGVNSPHTAIYPKEPIGKEALTLARAQQQLQNFSHQNCLLMLLLSKALANNIKDGN